MDNNTVRTFTIGVVGGAISSLLILGGAVWYAQSTRPHIVRDVWSTAASETVILREYAPTRRRQRVRILYYYPDANSALERHARTR